MSYLFKAMVLILLMNSCKTRYVKAKEFYAAWETNSKPISKNKFENLPPLDKTVYNIYEHFLDSVHSTKNRLLPNLKYSVIDNTMDVLVCDSIIKTEDVYGRLFFEPINSQIINNYTLFPRSESSKTTLLYYDKKYRNIINKRKRFSSKSVYGLKKDKNIMAVFSGVAYYPIGKLRYKSLLFRTTDITISKDLKSAVLQIHNDFGSKKIYYTYNDKKDFWSTQEFDKWSDH